MGNTLKEFSLCLYFPSRLFEPWGSLFETAPQIIGRCVWDGWPSVQGIQSASLTSDEGRGHLQGMAGDPMSGQDTLTSPLQHLLCSCDL